MFAYFLGEMANNGKKVNRQRYLKKENIKEYTMLMIMVTKIDRCFDNNYMGK